MKKTILIVSLMASIISFSNIPKSQQTQYDIEFKTMIHLGYGPNIFVKSGSDFYADKVKAFRIAAEGTLYRPFYVPKINTIFNLGLGVSLEAVINKEFYKNDQKKIHYVAIIPYISGEVAGYINKDVRLYGGVDLGGVSHYTIKVGSYLGLTYKERFTTELSVKYPFSVMVGFGSRFNYTRKPKIVEKTVYLDAKEYEKMKMEMNEK